MSYRREKMDANSSIKKVIQWAKDGDRSSAWALVSEIHSALKNGSGSENLRHYAAGFFKRLLDLYNEGKESPNDLASAFSLLHIVRPQGKQPRDELTSNRLAARVALLRLRNCSVDAAVNSLADTCFPNEDPLSRNAYLTSYSEMMPGTERLSRGERFCRMFKDVTPTELEVLAGFTAAELMAEMSKVGTLPKFKG